MRRMKLPTLFLFPLFVTTFVACSPNQVSGTIQGASMKVHDAIFYTKQIAYSVNGAAKPATGVAVVLSDKENLCASIRAGQVSRDETQIRFLLTAGKGVDGTSDRLNEGSYVPPPSNLTYGLSGNTVLLAAYVKSDDNCAATTILVDNLPSVQVSSFQGGAGGSLVGSASLKFGLDSVDAEFTAAQCDHLEPANPPDPQSCK